MIQDTYKSLVNTASGLGDYQSISKTDLANGYCDADEAHDEVKRNQYMAALMLRYWYKIYEWNKEKNLKLTLDDFVSWLYESFEMAFKYRRWRDPNDKLYKDPNGPDKVFNRAIFSTRNRYYDYFNKDKRRINFYTYSLEESIELHGDSADGLNVEDDPDDNPYNDLIQSYINKNKLLEAVILNNILYEPVFKTEVTRIKTGQLDENKHPIVLEKSNNQFNFKRLVKSIKYINNNFIQYFANKYELEPNTKQTLLNFSKLSSNVLNNQVKDAMLDLKKDKELLSLLCY